jgi:hypothetical protein
MGVRAGDAIAACLHGSDIERAEYQASLALRFRHYLENRNYFYGMERRWPTSAFWMKRRARTAVERAWQPPRSSTGVFLGAGS